MELLYIIIGVVVLTGLVFYGMHIKKKREYVFDIPEGLDVVRLAIEFARRVFADNFNDKNKIDLYSTLILEGLEYIKVFASDRDFEMKINMGMNNIVRVANELDVELSQKDILLIRDILKLTYGIYGYALER
jgi:hypothetical protein